MLLPEAGSLDGTSDGTNISCTYFQTQEDLIFVSFSVADKQSELIGATLLIIEIDIIMASSPKHTIIMFLG